MSTITPLSSIPPLGSYSSRQGTARPDSQGTPPLGEIIKATVLEARSGERYLLEIAGNRLLASSQASLTPGQQLQLQVISTAPQVELKIVSDVFSALAGRSLVLLGTTLDLSALFASLTKGSPGSSAPFSQLSTTSGSTLASFLPEGMQTIINSREGGEFLRNLFNRLGLNLETLLAQGSKNQAPLTLKAALLEIAHLFQHSERISDQVGKLLATLELYQLAQLQLGQERFLIFPLPLPFLDQGYVLVEQHGEDDGGQEGQPDEQHFSLHLSLTGLGHLRIVFLLNQEGLFIRFHLESQEKATFAAQFEQQLKDMLTAAPLVSVSFSDGAGDPAGELVRRLFPQEQTLLDTTA
jgi:hypothetical protein